MPKKEDDQEKIPLEDIKRLPPKVFMRIIQQIRDHIRDDETLNRIFKEYGVDIAELDYVPMCFADIDVSGKTDHGIIYFNYKLLCDGDISKVFSYAIHELCHFCQQTSGDKPTKGADDGDYLKNPYEVEGFQNQVEFIANHEGEDEAVEYVDDLLDHHDKEGKEKDKLEDILLDKVAAYREELYVVFSSGNDQTFYGPFPSEDAAKKASYFGQSLEVSDKNQFYRYPFKVYRYSDEEIEAAKNDPESLGYGKVTFHPPHIPVHPSWVELWKEDGRPVKQDVDNWWEGKITGR